MAKYRVNGSRKSRTARVYQAYIRSKSGKVRPTSLYTTKAAADAYVKSFNKVNKVHGATAYHEPMRVVSDLDSRKTLKLYQAIVYENGKPIRAMPDDGAVVYARARRMAKLFNHTNEPGRRFRAVPCCVAFVSKFPKRRPLSAARRGRGAN